MTRPHYRLTYFNAQGLAEPIRFIFAYIGIDYEDVRIPIPDDISEETRIELKKEYGYLPSLEIDGVAYTQGFAIAFYLAKQYGLVSEDEFENLRIEETVHQVREHCIRYGPLFYKSVSKDKKDELLNRLLTVDTPNAMSKFNNMVNKNKEHGWLVGDKMTLADICFAHYTMNIESCMELNILKEFPKLQQLRNRVFNQPGIKEYIASRPDTKF